MNWKYWQRIRQEPTYEHIIKYRQYIEPTRKQPYIIDYVRNKNKVCALMKHMHKLL